jgi:hypothetical protein
MTTPAAAMLSFTLNGTPWSGPHDRPAASASSASRARASARSASTCTTALTAPSTSAMRRRCASTTSRRDGAVRDERGQRDGGSARQLGRAHGAKLIRRVEGRR